MSGIYAAAHMVGGMTADYWERDPRRLAFVLARYKAVSKLLAGKQNVLEIGCADAFGSRIVRQTVGKLTAVDIDPQSIEEAKRNASENWQIEFTVWDIMKGPALGFDAVFALDVYEHIPPADEHTFLENLRACAPVAIVGTPSAESQVYASDLSRKGHCNCKSGEDLRASLLRHWRHVFMLCLNDETIHLGHFGMAHYLLAICCE